MNAKTKSVIRQLTSAELDAVTGGLAIGANAAATGTAGSGDVPWCGTHNPGQPAGPRGRVA